MTARACSLFLGCFRATRGHCKKVG
jgi:hypothetical protein